MKQMIKGLLLLLVMLCCSKQLNAQLQGRPLIDSLILELSKQKEDSNKVIILNDLSFDYSDFNPDTGIMYGQIGLELATKQDWKKGIAWANSRLGINFLSKSDHPKALEYFLKSLKIHEVIGNNLGIATVKGNIGNLYSKQKEYQKALKYFLEALKIDEKLGDTDRISTVTGNIANVYSELTDYPKALEFYFNALALYENKADKKGIARNFSNIGNVYIHMMKYTEAIWFMQQSLILANAIGDKESISANLCNIGECYLSIVNDPSIKSSKIDTHSKSSIYMNPSIPSLPTDRAILLNSAITYLKRSIAISKELNIMELLQEAYENLSEAYKLNGNFKKAFEYKDSSSIVKDSIFSQNKRDKILSLEEARKAYGDSLQTASVKKELEIKTQHRRIYEYIGFGVLLLALVFILIISRYRNQLAKEKKRSDNLLLNILPEEVASQLKDTGAAAAKRFDDVTVLFTDFVNFTKAGESMSPEVLIEELNTCFKKFDEITGNYNIEKIKTIGDAYLAVCGLPTPDPKHAENMIKAAQEISAYMQDREAKLGNRTFQVRIGIHSGSVVAGIVGSKKFAYDIWGDTVNTAARMEQNSTPGKINISQTTYELIKDKFDCEYRGEIDAKGKGQLKMYYVSARATA